MNDVTAFKDIPHVTSSYHLGLSPNRILPPWLGIMLHEAHNGRAEVAVVTCSIFWTSATLLLTRKRPKRQDHQSRSIYGLLIQASRFTALCTSLLSHLWNDGNWSATTALGYVWLLGFAETQSGGLTSVTNQSTFISVLISAVMFTANAMPLLIIDTNYAVKPLALASTAFIFLSIVAVGIMPRQPRRADDGAAAEYSRTKMSKEESASWFDYWCTFGRMNSVITKGWRGHLVVENLDELPWDYQPSVMLPRIKTLRQKHKTTAKTLFALVGGDLVFASFFASMFFVAELIIPLGMYYLLEYLSDPDHAVFKPSLWLLVMLGGRLVGTVVQQQLAFHSGRASLKIKTALTAEIYHCAMESRELSQDFLSSAGGRSKKSSAGVLANLISSDVKTIMQGRTMILVIFGGPIGSVLGLVGMYKLVGWPCLVGLAITMLGSPITAWLSNRIAASEEQLKDAQDSRISITTEYIKSIKIVKYFGWEDTIVDVINAAREDEQKHLWSLALLSTAITDITYSVPVLSLLAIFGLYTGVQGNSLTASVAYTTISLLEIVRDNATVLSSISIYIPKIRVSLKRIDRYFAAATARDAPEEGPVQIQNAAIRRSASAEFRLYDISVEFIQGGINAVVGPSGSGKTTLLLSMLGETVLESGSISRPNDVAFASQSPWLQAVSLRENVLFTADYDAVKYEAIIEACCLNEDLKEMPGGDSTNVGINGQALSGGQRARVALARALYSDAPLLLLDDIFSSLDVKTAVLLWNNVFCSKLLEGRTVILVTQTSWIPPECDLVVTLENGQAKSSTNKIVRRPKPFEKPPKDDIADVLNASNPKLDDSDSDLDSESEDEDSSSESIAPSRFQFLAYIRYFGGPLAISSTITTLILYNLAELATNFWMSNWVDTAESHLGKSTAYYLGIYVLLSLVSTLSDGMAYLTFMRGSWVASKRLHAELVSAITQTSLFWLEKTSIGKIMNRLSDDIDTLDQSISEPLKDFLDELFKAMLMLGAVSGIIPLILAPVFLLSMIGVYVGDIYSRAIAEVKNLVSSAQAPVTSRLAETVEGAIVIRARNGVQPILDKKIYHLLYTSVKTAAVQRDCDQWLRFRLNSLAAIMNVLAGICALYTAGSISAGLVGFSLSQASSMSQGILRLIFKLNDLNASMLSFQRVSAFCKLEPEEAPKAESKEHELDPPWPRSSDVEFNNVTVRYSPDGPDVLKDVSIKFDAKERTAIVGRTGSGKTTVILSLLGFTHIVSGTILYDGVDITTISKKRLRQAIAMVPQDPLLFQGTISSNLDPGNCIDVAQLQRTLNKCSSIENMQKSDKSVSFKGRLMLDTAVSAGGSNFSHGQRQVLSLCRALSRETHLMLLDEATSSVDSDTDAAIQSVLRDEVCSASESQRGLITIAHRLQTILDYDKIVVMGFGKVLEAGSPKDLLAMNGMFHDMVKHSK